MTDTTSHRATPVQWATVAQFAANGDELAACVMELLSRVQRLEDDATCPHIVSSDEGTSYCGLAEQQARIGQPDVPADTSAEPAPTGSLVDVVENAIAIEDWLNNGLDESACGDDDPNYRYTSSAHRSGHGFLTMQARAAIRTVAEWLLEGGWENAASVLEQEAKR